VHTLCDKIAAESSANPTAQFLAACFSPGERFEIRCFKPNDDGASSKVFDGADVAAATKYAARQSASGRYQGVFYTLNPVNLGAGSTRAASDANGRPTPPPPRRRRPPPWPWLS
jgi:hypothetical protein